MEKAILKTLIYADIFDYPLKAYEIHKWLIGRKVSLREVEQVLIKLNQESRIKNHGVYYFLPRRGDLAGKRKIRQKQSAKYLRKAKALVQILRLIPWIKLVGISGGLAMDNAQKKDDIDLFIITSNSRLWVSRLFALGLLSLTGQRRKVGENGRKIAGKLCINTLLEEDKLEQRNKDIYLAHEILQMKILWEKDGIYQKYLEDNEWAFKFLPNWTVASSLRAPRGGGKLLRNEKIASSLSLLAMTAEKSAKWFQLKIMQPQQGLERIQDGALYFHPEDARPRILMAYRKRTRTYDIGPRT